MTLDESETAPDDILSALKEDGSARAPFEARARVLSRLVGVAAGVAAVSHATIASGAAKAASTSAAPAVGGVLGLGLVKALIAHPVLGVMATLAIGSGVGVGTYQAFEPSRADAPVVTKPRVALTDVPKLAEAPEAAPTAPTASEPVDAEPAASPVVAPPSVAPRVRGSERPREPALVPAPDLPENASPARLAEQQALLDQARASLRRGDGAGALAIAKSHEKLYPVTQFVEEREAIEILALVMVGQSDAARTRGESFAKRFPTSLFLPSIRAALAPHAAAGDGESRE